MKQLTLEHLLSRKRPARSDETRPRTRARVQACIAPVEALGAAANVGDVHMDDQPGALASTGGAGGAQVEVLSGAMPKRLNEGVGVARIGGGEEGGGGKGEEKVGRRPARRKTQASTVLDWAGGLPAAARTGGGSGGRSGRAARRAAVKERISDDGVGVVSVERRVQPRRSSRSARSALGPDDGAAVGVDVGESAVTVESVVAEKSSVMDGSAMEAVTIPKLPSLSASLRARELGLFTSSLSSDYVGALVCCREAAKPPLTVTSTYDGSDDFVSKVYAMAISNLGSEVRVAAGGHGGRFIVLKAPFEPVGNAEGNPRRGNRDAWDEAAEMNAEHDERNSILWWSDAHSPSWISDLCFNSPANVLVSSGNDGFLRCHNAFTGDPLSEIVHTTAGVYSMDVYGESSIASVAKDGSLLFSRLAGSTIRGEDVRVGAHKGVAKCVRWRWDGQLVITSGNDRCVRLFDKRDGSRAVSIVEDAHSLAINTVSFHPENQDIFLSSSFDGYIKVFDARQISEPLIAVNRHNRTKGSRSSAMLHPLFYANGETVLAAGDSAKSLTQYSTRTGRVVASHPIDFRSPSVICLDKRSGTLYMPLGSKSRLASLRSRVVY